MYWVNPSNTTQPVQLMLTNSTTQVHKYIRQRWGIVALLP